MVHCMSNVFLLSLSSLLTKLYLLIRLPGMRLRGGGAQYLVPTKSNLQPLAITSGLQVSPVPSEILLCMGVETSCQVARAVLGDAGHVRLMKKA